MQEFFKEYGWLLVAVFGLVYEVVSRYFPTERNLSILDFVHSILNIFIPNRKKSFLKRKERFKE